MTRGIRSWLAMGSVLVLVAGCIVVVDPPTGENGNSDNTANSNGDDSSNGNGGGESNENGGTGSDNADDGGASANENASGGEGNANDNAGDVDPAGNDNGEDPDKPDGNDNAADPDKPSGNDNGEDPDKPSDNANDNAAGGGHGNDNVDDGKDNENGSGGGGQSGFAVFSDPASSFMTADVLDVEGQVVRFDAEHEQMFWVEDELRFDGWDVNGNRLAHGSFQVRFGTSKGVPGAYFTETGPATICDLVVANGRLSIFPTNTPVPQD